MATPTIDYQKLADDARKGSGAVDYAALADQARSGTPAVKPPYKSDLRKVPLVGGALGYLDENFVEPGIDRAAKGAQKMMAAPTAEKSRGQNIVGGASEVARGLGQAMAPPLLVSGTTAPVKLAAGLATGLIGQQVTEKGLKVAGVPEEYANAAGDVVGAVAGGAAAHGAPNKLSNPLRVDPRIGINRSIRPVPSNPDFPAQIPKTLKAILDANGGKVPGGITEGTLDVIPATNKAIDTHQDALQQWIDRGAHLRISGNPIVEATAQATKGMLPSEQGSANALVQRAAKDYGAEFTPQQLRDRLKLLNERLSPFFDKSPAKQSTALADIPDAVLKAQRDATAELLYKSLDPEGAGAGPRAIQSRTGDLIDLRDAATRRNNAIVAEQPLTPFGRLVDPIKAGIRAMIPGKATGAGIAYAEGSEGRSLPLLRRSFKAVRDEQVDPLPKPNGLYPTGLSDRLLTQGDVITPPPADTSSVHGAPAMAQPPNPRRAIMPGRGTIITPPPADTSGGRTTTGPPLQAPVSRQLPASRTAPPISDVRGGPSGDITDLVPSIDPVSGKVEYIPRPKRGNPLSDRLLYEDKKQ